MHQEKLIKKLDRFNYTYTVKQNVVIVSLGNQLEMKINYVGDKIIITDKLTSYNMLTGSFEMSIKNSLTYNSIAALAFGLFAIFISLFASDFINPSIFIFAFLIPLFWILLWSNYFITKKGNFRRFVEEIEE